MNEVGSVNEIWKPIEDYPRYQVSTLGRVKSFCYNKNGKVMSQHKSRGYARLQLCKNNINTSYSVHRLVGEAFLENPNNLPQINHKNGIRDDNRIENLEWCTPSQNIIHAFKVLKKVAIGCHVKRPRGEKHSSSKITGFDVMAIRGLKLANPLISQVKLAKMFGLKQPQVSEIIRRVAWEHVLAID